VTYNRGTLATNSDAKVSNEVTLAAEKNVFSLLVFQELSGDLPTSTPYSELSLQSDYSAILRLRMNMVRFIPNTRITLNTVQFTGESIIKHPFYGTNS
jgi:hypothetical protein